MQAIKVYNLRGVDELIFLDITATLQGRRPEFALIDDLADECFMPLTVGGGVRSVEDVRGLLEVGADKVAVNTAAVEYPELVQEGADRFGSQCIVVSIDTKIGSDGRNTVWTRSGTQPTGRDPVELAVEVAEHGAGEILLTSIDRDGTMDGYDLAMIREITQAVSIPVIASGGAGNYEHMARAILDGESSAVAAASMFHFTEQTPREAKVYLREQNIPVRL